MFPYTTVHIKTQQWVNVAPGGLGETPITLRSSSVKVNEGAAAVSEDLD